MGEWLTRATIWIAMGLWCGAMVMPAGKALAVKWLWTVALVVYGAHILVAYQHFYQWSHQMAWEATAADTAATVGFDSGVGLLVNFVFALILLVDVVIPWRTGRRRGAAWIDGLILFMILNGAIVFGEGAVRIYGIFLLALTGLAVASRRIKSRGSS